MEAMILAAGLGTRLRPLTDRFPKALIDVAGKPLIAHVMDRLVEAGATRVVINTHHHEEQIRAYLRDHAAPDIDVVLSPEPDGPYDTGGGLFAAAPLFEKDGPFLLHNVDVLSKIPLDGLVETHCTARERSAGQTVASLAVQSRNSNRLLLFDSRGLLGWENRGSDGGIRASHHVREPLGALERWSFTGVHVLEPAVFALSKCTGVFSIITMYLELAEQGYTISPIDVSAHEWMDVGTPERLEHARTQARR
jgi:MurNAc alpha-1-phosphate uridylyltransferase